LARRLFPRVRTLLAEHLHDVAEESEVAEGRVAHEVNLGLAPKAHDRVVIGAVSREVHDHR
jgi:hypothetical protein